MKLIFLALCLSSVAIMAHGQSASSILKMASYANRLQKVPGMNRVMNSMMGRVVTKGGGMMATVLTSEKSTGLLSRTVGRVGAFIGRVMIRILSIVNNIITWFAKKGVNILGFVAELPLTLFNAMRMNAELLISTMDKYNIGIPGAIRNLEYIFFGIRPIPNLPMLASPMGTESMNLSPMGMGMSTQPMMMGPN